MKKTYPIGTFVLAVIALSALILDAPISLAGAKRGIELCLQVIIPSLFPFLILSCYISSRLLGCSIPFLRPLGKICQIPAGGESILLLGLLGGYPVGAKAIADAYHNKQLPVDTAKRMLGFCNNAGPAFIFGMLANVFTSRSALLLLWFIHMLSAIIVGVILPGSASQSCRINSSEPLTISMALDRSIRTLACICSWVIVFRILIDFCNHWFVWLMPEVYQVMFSGMLELANGCCALMQLPSEGLRFILASCFLAAGGICIGMQTASVVHNLGIGMYFPGKCLQIAISLILSTTSQYFIYHGTARIPILLHTIILLVAALATVYVLSIYKKNSGNPARNDV